MRTQSDFKCLSNSSVCLVGSLFSDPPFGDAITRTITITNVLLLQVLLLVSLASLLRIIIRAIMIRPI